MTRWSSIRLWFVSVILLPDVSTTVDDDPSKESDLSVISSILYAIQDKIFWMSNNCLPNTCISVGTAAL